MSRWSLALALAVAASWGCDEPAETPDTNDGLPTADMGPEPDVGPQPDVGPEPDGDVPPDADVQPDMGPNPDAAPLPGAAFTEVCVGCGRAESPRFTLTEHAVQPLPGGIPRAASSASYRLVLSFDRTRR